MLRAVCDTNIYISALNFGGIPGQILEYAQEGFLDLYISPPILEEIQGVLSKKFRWPKADILDAIFIIKGFTTMVYPTETVSVIINDPPDNRVLECAIAAEAQIIVSGDTDLKRLRKYKNIKIIGPREFLDRGWLK